MKRTIQIAHTQKRTLTPTCTSCYQVPTVAKKGHVHFPNFAWRLLRDLLLTFPIRRRGRIGRRARISRRLWSFFSEATTMACLYVLVVTHAPLREHQVCFPLWASFSLHAYRLRHRGIVLKCPRLGHGLDVSSLMNKWCAFKLHLCSRIRSGFSLKLAAIQMLESVPR